MVEQAHPLVRRHRRLGHRSDQQPIELGNGQLGQRVVAANADDAAVVAVDLDFDPARHVAIAGEDVPDRAKHRHLPRLVEPFVLDVTERQRCRLEVFEVDGVADLH